MKTLETVNYQQQAIDFLNEIGVKYSALYLKHDRHFPSDTDSRDIWRLSLSRNGKRVSFRFGQSIASTGETPTPYDLLATLVKDDQYDFEDFCSNFGYDTDSRKAEKIYKGCVREYEKVSAFFSEPELEKLREIQ